MISAPAAPTRHSLLGVTESLDTAADRLPQVTVITDPADPRLKDYVRLTDLALRTRSDLAEGLFLAEGELVMSRAIEAGMVPRSFLLADNRLALLPADLWRTIVATGAPVYVGSHAVLQETTGFHVHRGSLASFQRPPLRPVVDVLAGASSVLVLEEVNNHTNVGAIVRCAAALGIDALLLDPRSADPLYRRAVRVSMGSVFNLPWTRVREWPDGLFALRESGFRILAMTTGYGSVPLDEVTVGPGEKTAILLGAEGGGLTQAAMEAASSLVRIPMSAGIDSLNVGAAAAIACWALRPLRA